MHKEILLEMQLEQFPEQGEQTPLELTKPNSH